MSLRFIADENLLVGIQGQSGGFEFPDVPIDVDLESHRGKPILVVHAVKTDVVGKPIMPGALFRAERRIFIGGLGRLVNGDLQYRIATRSQDAEDLLMARASSHACSSTWLHKTTSNASSAKPISVTDMTWSGAPLRAVDRHIGITRPIRRIAVTPRIRVRLFGQNDNGVNCQWMSISDFTEHAPEKVNIIRQSRSMRFVTHHILRASLIHTPRKNMCRGAREQASSQQR